MRALIFALILFFAAQAAAVELNWTWKKGDVHRYRTRSTQTVGMDMMGMKVNAKHKIDATFAVRVKSVSRSGDARAELAVEKFVVTDDKGQPIASLAGLSPTAVVTPVIIDKKGHFTFERLVWLVVDDAGGSMLVSASANGSGASASARGGGQEVAVWARFDRKTGKLSAGYSTANVGRKTAKIRVKDNAQRIDLVPRQFLELLRLPVGPINKGDNVKARIADWQITTKVKAVDRKRGAKFEVYIETVGDGSGLSKPGTSVNGTQGGQKLEAGGAMPAMKGIPGVGGMPGGLGGMGAMGGMPGMPGAKAPAGGPAMPTLAMEGAFFCDFDIAAGRLTSIKGGIKTVQTVPGMGAGKIETDTLLVMERVK